MFKKLKDKIAEEVKSSPQRIQQLTQSAADRLQQSVTVDVDDYFTLADDDGSPNPSAVPAGFTDVSLDASTPAVDRSNRRHSNSSMASDVSFLPQYEASGSLYHMQSDLEVSASEVEDNVSMSSQLGHISKEQVYSAFQKAQLRYHKYRGRYTDIAGHYKVLEKENAKIKAVLVETQDKAIRRVSELREQCALEQKAKAHLENALRVELDERQIKIETLETKVRLLKNCVSIDKNAELLMDVGGADVALGNENSDVLTRQLCEARSEIAKLNERIQELKANAIIYNTKEGDYKQKLRELEKSLRDASTESGRLFQRERESNSKLLAQTKMELHAEIHGKDVEIDGLRREANELRQNLSIAHEKANAKTVAGSKLENLQAQNAKLIDKVEALGLKCQSYESDSVKLEQCRIENSNLNEIVANLKRMNEEVMEKNRVIGEELKNYEELRVSYDLKVRDLDRLSEELCESQQICKELREKQWSYQAAVYENGELQAKVLELQTAAEHNAATLRESNALRSELAELKDTVRKAKDEEVLCSLQAKEFEESLSKVRQDATSSLLTLETKIRDKLRLEYEEKEAELKEDFQRKLSELSSSGNDAKLTEIRLMECVDEVKLLKEKVECLEQKLENSKARYEELERNHLCLISENTDTRKELAELKNDIATKDDVIACVRTENALLQQAVAVSTEENCRIPNVSQAEDEISLLRAVSVRQQNENCDLQEDNRNLRRKIEESKGEIDELLKEKFIRDEEIVTLSAKLVELARKEYEGLPGNGSLPGEFEELSQKIGDLRMEVQEQAKENEEEVTGLMMQVRDMALDNEKFAKSNETLVEANFKLQAMLDEKEKILVKVNEEVERIVKEKRDLEEKFANLDQQQGDILVKYSDVEQLNEKLELRVRSVVKEKDELESELKMIKDYEKAISQKNEDLKMLVSTCKKENKQLNERVGALLEYESQYQGILDENHNLKEQVTHIEALRSELDALQSTYSSEKEVLTRGARDLEKRLAASQRSVELLKRDKQKLIEEVHALQMQMSETLRDYHSLQKNLAKLRLAEAESESKHACSVEEVEELQVRNRQLSSDYRSVLDKNEQLARDLEDLKIERLTDSSAELHKRLAELEAVESKSDAPRDENLTAKTETTYDELLEVTEALRSRVVEVERRYDEATRESQVLKDRIHEMEKRPAEADVNGKYLREVEGLRDKLEQYKSIDKTNRTCIEFYENELEKYKVKNEKLARKVDETLVSLPTVRNDSSSGVGRNNLSARDSSAVLEYLRNVLFNYMTGKESLVLAKVIAAVCKFDEQQTELIVQRELQKQTLLGQLFGS